MSWIDNNFNFFISEQNSLKNKYPGLHYKKKENLVLLLGEINFTATFNNIEIHDSYNIEIHFPDSYPQHPPIVWEVNAKIDPRHHRYSNGALCLGTGVDVVRFFRSNPTILNFLENILIPYLYFYSYKLKFNSEPWSERSHGTKGIFEFYQDFLKLKDEKKIIDILNSVINKAYKGHMPCPCGSKVITRKCHGEKIFELYSIPKLYIQNDLEQIFNAIEDYLKRIPPGVGSKLDCNSFVDKRKFMPIQRLL